MKIGIVGAGFAGLSAGKTLKQLGHDVTIYEKAADVGGVWSASRRYPGLRTQNAKSTYALSGLKMSGSYPQWVESGQVQEYLAQYAEKFDLTGHLHLSTEVTAATPVQGGGWDVTTKLGTEHFDHLVLANGIFSRPFVPKYDGVDALTEAGGRILPASELHSLDDVAGKNVIVVGYGKSACDVTVEIAKVAASTTVVARNLIWKMPRKIKGVVNYKFLLLTRLGEALFPYRTRRGFEKVLHAGNSKIANGMIGSIEKVTTKQLKLKKNGLVPDGPFTNIARANVSLATEGFFEGVDDGSIVVKRDTEIARFVVKDGKPFAELSNGETLAADVVIAATGWNQDIPFLPAEVMDKLVDENGDYLLYRQIHPIHVPDLSFAGYNSSFFSPLSAEVSAIWIGSRLGGNHQLPSTAEMLTDTKDRLIWMRERTNGRHARGTNLIPFSVHQIDEVLSEVGINVGVMTRFNQWLMPINPQAYKKITAKLAKRIGARAA